MVIKLLRNKFKINAFPIRLQDSRLIKKVRPQVGILRYDKIVNASCKLAEGFETHETNALTKTESSPRGYGHEDQQVNCSMQMIAAECFKQRSTKAVRTR